jgi:hypothetical protein
VEVRINAPSTDGYGQAVSDLQPPERGHDRAVVGHSVNRRRMAELTLNF